jgi:hypothetical protein
MSSKRISQILTARGINGVIILPGYRGGAHLSLEWDSFSAVGVGYSMLRTNLDRVCQDQYQGIRLALKQLYLHGYKRPGWSFTAFRISVHCTYGVPVFTDMNIQIKKTMSSHYLSATARGFPAGTKNISPMSL